MFLPLLNDIQVKHQCRSAANAERPRNNLPFPLLFLRHRHRQLSCPDVPAYIPNRLHLEIAYRRKTYVSHYQRTILQDYSRTYLIHVQ